MGSSIYHTGIQTRKWGQSQELTKLTEAMYNARELAMTRMEEEALELGADGVVGVRLDVNYYEWGKDAAEFIAVGTAVKAESGVSHRNKLGKPFTSDLSGQDFWTLMQTGHIPQGLVMGTCVYHIAHRGLGATLGSAGQNVELPNFTQALYEARELAMTRMQDEANELGASGIVGVRLEEKSHQWGSHTIEFLSLGTAVVKTSDEVTLPTPDHHHLARQLMTVPAERTRRPSRGGGPPLRRRCLHLRADRPRLRRLPPDGPRAGRLHPGLLRHAVAVVRDRHRMGMGGGFGSQWGGVRGYSETWNCPHGFVSGEHRSWGQNYEQAWVEDAWTTGFTTAYDRMVEEAASGRRPRHRRRGRHVQPAERHGRRSSSGSRAPRCGWPTATRRPTAGRGPPTWPASAWPSWSRPATPRCRSPPRWPRCGCGPTASPST